MEEISMARDARELETAMRSRIASLFEQVAREQQKSLAPLRDDLRLIECGLDSLSFALIVARLEDALGCDPFASAQRFPVTFGEFVRMYRDFRR